MKILKTLFLLAVIGILLYSQGFEFPSAIDPPPPADEREGAPIRRTEFRNLLDRRQPLSELAVAGQYTVVEVYLDSCAICRRLESGFQAFTDKRRDVTIRRVHFPEDGLQIEVSGATQQEMEANARSIQTLMDSICGTPHVEVYGPDRQPIARDLCGDKSGTEYLRGWIAAETALGDLLASGPRATPLPGPR